MKKNILFFIFVFPLVVNAQQIISPAEFDSLKRTVLSIEYAKNDYRGEFISLNIKYEIDSTSVFSGLLEWSNNQFPGFLFTLYFDQFHEPLKQFLPLKEDSVQLDNAVCNYFKTQKQFYQDFSDILAFYLKSKNILVKDYSYNLREYTKEDYFNRAAKFLYFFKDEKTGSPRPAVCGGTNPYVMEPGTSEIPILETFAWKQICDLVYVEDGVFINHFFNDWRLKVKEQFKDIHDPDKLIIEFRKATYEHYENDPDFQKALMDGFEKDKHFLPFVIK